MDSPGEWLLSRTGDSVIRNAVSETMSGKTAVIAKTPLVPQLSINAPLK